MGAKISKRCTTRFETYPEFSSQWSSQKHVWDFWNFEFLISKDFFFENSNFPMIVAYGEIKTLNIWKSSDRRAKRSEIWDSWVDIQHIRGSFGLLAFGALAIFRNLGLMIRDKTFWAAMRANRWELDMQLLYMSIGNHVWRIQWHHQIWPWVAFKGQIQGDSDFEVLYLVKEKS